MANFEPKQLVANKINGGNKYRNLVDSLQADAFNRLIEAILYAQQNGVGVNITVDSELSNNSTNPVQNKVVKAELDKKLDINAATSTGYPKYLYGYNPIYQKAVRYNVQGVVGGENFNKPNMTVITHGTGQVKGAMPINPEDLTPKKYVEDIKEELLEIILGIPSQWRNVNTIFNMPAYLSATKLGEPQKVKITEFHINEGDNWMDMEMDEWFYQYETRLIAPQTFDEIQADENGIYTVTLNCTKTTYTDAHEVDKTENVVIPISFDVKFNRDYEGQVVGGTSVLAYADEGTEGGAVMSLYI